MQGTTEAIAKVACRDMGFADGSFVDSGRSSFVRPPWLSVIQCNGNETDVGKCERSGYGETFACADSRGDSQKLFCFNDFAGVSLIEEVCLPSCHPYATAIAGRIDGCSLAYISWSLCY